jgi:hypothetical protein
MLQIFGSGLPLTSTPKSTNLISSNSGGSTSISHQQPPPHTTMWGATCPFHAAPLPGRRMKAGVLLAKEGLAWGQLNIELF